MTTTPTSAPPAGPTRPRRRRTLVVVGVVVAAAMLVTSLRVILSQAEPLTGPITLVTTPDFTFRTQLQRAVECWNQRDEDEDERVTYLQLPRAADDQRAHLMSKLQAGNDGDDRYDMVGLDVVWTQEFAKAGLIRPLDEVAELAYGGEAHERAIDMRRFLDVALETVRFEGRDWAVPLRSNVSLLYYNKEYVEEDQVPTTWEELADLSRDRPDGVEGYLGQFLDYEGLHTNAAEVVWAHGGGFVDPSGQVAADADETVAGLAFLASGIREGWIPEAALGYDEQASLQAFQNGDAMFLRHWPYAHARLNEAESPVEGLVGVAQLPGQAEPAGTDARGGPNTFGGANLAVPQSGRHPMTAYEFIRFLTSENVQRAMLEQGGYPASVPDVYQAGQPGEAAESEIEGCGSDGETPSLGIDQDHRDTVQAAFANARSRPATPYYDRVTKLIQDAVHRVLNDATSQTTDSSDSIRAAMETLGEDLREALRGR